MCVLHTSLLWLDTCWTRLQLQLPPQIDITLTGWLDTQDALLALKSVTTGMTNAEETYLYRASSTYRVFAPLRL